MTAERVPGVVVGSLIATVFGTVFIEVNSGGLPGSWPMAIRIGGAVVALALLVGILLVARRPAGEPTGPGFVDRRYWTIVGIEGLALFGGLVLINAVLNRPSVAVAWIAVVVGVHFIALAKVWRLPLFLPLGYVQTGLGLAGFVLGGLHVGAEWIGLVSGVGSGIALFATVAVGLTRPAPA